MSLSPPHQVVRRSPSPSRPQRDHLRALRRNDGLCIDCAALDFEEVLLTPRLQRFAKKARRWQMYELLENGSEHAPLCPFCGYVARMVARAVTSTSDVHLVTAVPRPFSLDLFVWLNTSDDTTGQKTTTRTHICTIRHLPRDGEDEIGDAPHGREIGKEKLNPAVISRWLQLCNDGHRCQVSLTELSANTQQTLKDDDFVLRVLDVATATVIDAPAGCKYAALSYVWGEMNLSELNRRMMSTTQGYCSVFGERESLPQSIREAIDLCQEIGIAYLWVDCLCILQNDAHDKHVQINNMDRIYSEAHLTIVSAMGSDANGGLPGVNPGTRVPDQLTLQTPTLSLTTTIVNPADPLINSYWYTRGWTFQEFVLSRRVLVFTRQQMLFCCREAFWTEDMVLEGDTTIQKAAVQIPSELGILSDLKFDKLSVSGAEITHATTTELYVNIYSRAILIFSERNLSREADALDAFAGIQRVLEPVMGTFVWGLPARWLWLALMWRTYSGLMPRLESKLQHVPDNFNLFIDPNGFYGHEVFPRRDGFPSWTWAAYRYGAGRRASMLPMDTVAWEGSEQKELPIFTPAVDIYGVDSEGCLHNYVASLRELPLTARKVLFPGVEAEEMLPTFFPQDPADLDSPIAKVRRKLLGTKSPLYASLLILDASVLHLPLVRTKDHYTYNHGGSVSWSFPNEMVGENPQCFLVALATSADHTVVHTIMVQKVAGIYYKLPLPWQNYGTVMWEQEAPKRKIIYLA